MENLCDIIERDLFHGKIPHFSEYAGSQSVDEFFHLTMLDFSNVQEITAYSDGRVFVKRSFNLWEQQQYQWPENWLNLIAQVYTIDAGVEWNIAKPFASFEKTIREHKLRISIVHPELTPNKQVKMNLRFLDGQSIQLEQFGNLSQLSTLNNIIKNKDNVLVVGPTGSGKTTLLNAMVKKTDQNEHLVILEDTQEITAPHANTTQLIAQNKENYSLEDYCKYAMRLSPNRLVLGEIRSSEVTPFILLMNSGHKGLMASLHANSAKDALTRMATLMSYYSKLQSDYNQLLKIIAQAVDYVVYVEAGKIKEMIKVNGSDNGVIYFEDACSSFEFEQAS